MKEYEPDKLADNTDDEKAEKAAEKRSSKKKGASQSGPKSQLSVSHDDHGHLEVVVVRVSLTFTPPLPSIQWFLPYI